MNNVERIKNDLMSLGVKKGDTLIVHTAFSKIGNSVTADELTKGLTEALGDDGTLVVPTLSWSVVTKENPFFDVKNTNVCIGYFPEYFRNRKDTVRSVHPTHSCAALGKNSVEITKNHYLDDTPVGKNSPFAKAMELNGKVLFLGCETEPNTSMHGVEELVKPDYLFGDDITYTITDSDGKTYRKTYHTHGFDRTHQRYERMESLLSDGEISYGKVLCADSVLMCLKPVWKKGEEFLKKDSHYFVDIY